MSKIKDFKQILDILLKYDLGDEMLESGHDIIYLPVEKDNVSKKDFKELEKLGAFEDEENCCLSVWA